MNFGRFFILGFFLCISHSITSLALAMEKNNLKVLSMHAWMIRTEVPILPNIPYSDWSVNIEPTSNNDLRMQLIPAIAAQSNADVIIMQELWRQDVRDQMAESLKKYGYEYVAEKHEYAPEGFKPREASIIGAFMDTSKPDSEEYSAVEYILDKLSDTKTVRKSMGNGLIIFSKYPIACDVKQMRFYKHPKEDYRVDKLKGESGVMKGAIKTCVEVPGIGKVDISASHLGAARYEVDSGNWNESDFKARKQQTAQLAQFIRKHTNPSRPFIGGYVLGHYFSIKDGKWDISDFSPIYKMMVGSDREYVKVSYASDDLPKALRDRITPKSIQAANLRDSYIEANKPQNITTRSIEGLASFSDPNGGILELFAQPHFTESKEANSLVGEYGAANAEKGYLSFEKDPPLVNDYLFMNENPVLIPAASIRFLNKDLTEADYASAGLNTEALKGEFSVDSLPKRLSTHTGILSVFCAAETPIYDADSDSCVESF